MDFVERNENNTDAERDAFSLEPTKADAYNLQTLSRGSAVLNLLYDRDRFSLKDAATELALNSTIVFRLLRTWVASGYLHYDPETKLYGPGLMLMRLAAKTSYHVGIPEVEARLKDLSRRIEQTCSCGVLAGRYALYIARVLANKALTYRVEVGKTLPAYATSMGQLLLAHEPEEKLLELFPEEDLPGFTDHTPRTRNDLFDKLALIREQGYAINSRQLSVGISAIAVPVRNARGAIVAALSTAGPADEFTNELVYQRYLPGLLEAASQPVDLRF